MYIEDFIIEINPQYHGFVQSLNDYLVNEGCVLKMKTAILDISAFKNRGIKCEQNRK